MSAHQILTHNLNQSVTSIIKICQKGCVMTLMKTTMPGHVSFHCVAHRLELAVGSSVKGSYYTEVINLLDIIEYNIIQLTQN